MRPPTLFISYSHEDEWLKDELVTHLSALKRNGTIAVWHDRLIPAGKKLDDEIDQKVTTADIFLFLISPHFINSDYCIHKEYEIAKKREEIGEATIVPIIVRHCDWDVGGLKSFKGLPRDGLPVTNNAVSKADHQQRDAAWLQVVDGLKGLIGVWREKITPPTLSTAYADALFLIDFIRHPSTATFDERSIFVEPDIYYENTKEQLGDIKSFIDIASAHEVSLITGGDRSGKTFLAKKIQVILDSSEQPAVLIKGE